MERPPVSVRLSENAEVLIERMKVVYGLNTTSGILEVAIRNLALKDNILGLPIDEIREGYARNAALAGGFVGVFDQLLGEPRHRREYAMRLFIQPLEASANRFAVATHWTDLLSDPDPALRKAGSVTIGTGEIIGDMLEWIEQAVVIGQAATRRKAGLELGGRYSGKLLEDGRIEGTFQLARRRTVRGTFRLVPGGREPEEG